VRHRAATAVEEADPNAPSRPGLPADSTTSRRASWGKAPSQLMREPPRSINFGRKGRSESADWAKLRPPFEVGRLLEARL